jgi:glycosyltransferase involved in cell wall biosynthesis
MRDDRIPRLSIIVPVHNGGQSLQLCLQALAASSRAPDEVIVVDDGSTDSSADQGWRHGARVVRHRGAPRGPAFARNRGVETASGSVMVFIDADVVVHRYTHQHSRREASTFWAGCGAVRRDAFTDVGGFDENYTRPSIEDIEFGVRLRKAGYHVWLCPEVLVTHLKHWNLLTLLRSDICDRAIPWTRLILRDARLPDDLNLDITARLSALAAWSLLLGLAFGFWHSFLWIGAMLAGFALVTLNVGLYRCYMQKGGVCLTLVSSGLHWLYLLYSSLAFIGTAVPVWLAQHVRTWR